VADVEDLIARRVNLILLAPREYEGLAPALQAAKEAKIPVVLVDREAAARRARTTSPSSARTSSSRDGAPASGWPTQTRGRRASSSSPARPAPRSRPTAPRASARRSPSIPTCRSSPRRRATSPAPPRRA
jgi:hypothetical protein